MIETKILEYNSEAYHSFYDYEFIASFTHTNLATGQIDADKVLELVERLNGSARIYVPSISFEQEMVKGDQLVGGSCSAIAFRVAKKALLLMKEHPPLNPSNRELCFAIRFSEFVRNFEEDANSKRQQAKVIQFAIRNEQAAFNTITVDRDLIRCGNGVSEKISALALFYELKVVKSSCELRVKGNAQLEQQLLEQIKNFKAGVYLMRIIQEKYNHKLEEKGHTAVYIHTGCSEYYFDPALGAHTVFPESTKPHLIFNALLSANQRFGVDVASFHQIEEVEK